MKFNKTVREHVQRNSDIWAIDDDAICVTCEKPKFCGMQLQLRNREKRAQAWNFDQVGQAAN